MYRWRTIRSTVVALLAIVGGTACADLDVTNVNEADRQRAITTAADVESLISGGFNTWWRTSGQFFPSADVQGRQFPGPFLANQSFQMASWPANEGMVFYSSFPRPAIPNQSLHQYFNNWADTWTVQYEMLAGVNEGLRALEGDESVREELGEARVTRARAFARFVQGLGHGAIALFYSQGFVTDETTDPAELSGDMLVDNDEVLQAALGYLDQAISIASGADFTIPQSWMSQEVSADQLVRLAHSYKARFRANNARTPEERAAVDWQAVLNDALAGVESDWHIVTTDFFYSGDWAHEMFATPGFAAWQQMSYFILGMADQSGRYQEWLSMDVNSRHPDLPSGERFIIETPDERFPQGSTREEQIENPGTHYEIQTGVHFDFAWRNPARGMYRWSYYRSSIHDPFIAAGGIGRVAEVTKAEMDLLAAEAHLRLGSPGTAASIVNEYRTAAGLSETDASGTNADCVPRLPDGSCGDLMEMLKWEKRLNTDFRGVFSNSWYFDGRGWGDLYRCTQLELPVPEQEALLAGIAVSSTGGCGGDAASPGSVYDFPGE